MLVSRKKKRSCQEVHSGITFYAIANTESFMSENKRKKIYGLLSFVDKSLFSLLPSTFAFQVFFFLFEAWKKNQKHILLKK